MDINLLLAVLAPAAGLVDLWNNVLSNWITPLFFAAVAVFAIIFIKDRAWMKLIGFVGIAAIVGVLIFAGPALFGNQGALKKTAEKAAKQINTSVIAPAGVSNTITLDTPVTIELKN